MPDRVSGVLSDKATGKRRTAMSNPKSKGGRTPVVRTTEERREQKRQQRRRRCYKLKHPQATPEEVAAYGRQPYQSVANKVKQPRRRPGRPTSYTDQERWASAWMHGKRSAFARYHKGATEAEFQAWLRREQKPKLTPDEILRNGKRSSLKRYYTDWTPAQIEARLDELMQEAQDGYVKPPKKAKVTPVAPKPWSVVVKAPIHVQPAPTKKTNAKSEKKEKPPKVWPTVDGKVWCKVELQEENGKGYQKPMQVIVSPERVEKVRAKYEARNARFWAPEIR